MKLLVNFFILEAGSPYVDQTGLELEPWECWNSRLVPLDAALGTPLRKPEAGYCLLTSSSLGEGERRKEIGWCQV